MRVGHSAYIPGNCGSGRHLAAYGCAPARRWGSPFVENLGWALLTSHWHGGGPVTEGYYFTADNADRAAGSYQEFAAWTRRHQLAWDGVGLDIEPDARIFLQIMENPWGLGPMLAGRLVDRARPARSKAAYQALVEWIRADGWRVEN